MKKLLEKEAAEIHSGYFSRLVPIELGNLENKLRKISVRG